MKRASHLTLISILLLSLLAVGGVGAVAFDPATFGYWDTSLNATALNLEGPASLSSPNLGQFRDGNIATIGVTFVGTDGKYGYNFSSSRHIGAIRWYHYADSSHMRYWYPQYSNDGITWTNATITGWWDGSTQSGTVAEAAHINGWNAVNFTSVNGTYFRIRVYTLWDGDTGSQHTELQMYEAPPPQVPFASFTSTNISVATNSTASGWEGYAPFTMFLNDTSSGTPTTWNWTAAYYPAAASVIATTRNVSHAFTTGNVSVRLNVTNSYGYNLSQPIWINVTTPTISADFVGAPLYGEMPLTVSFVDYTTAAPPVISWYWDFGDGNTSVEANPTHIYVTPGFHTVSLNATNIVSDIETKINYIYVNVTPASSFSSTNISLATNSTDQGWAGTAPFTMQFANTSTKPPHTSWTWNYTELSAPTIPVTFNSTGFYSPIYEFVYGGNYSISLDVAGPYGSNISIQKTWVNVSQYTPIVSFTTNVTSGFAPLALYLNDTSTQSPLYWNTSWGDLSWTNQTSFPATNITHVYTTVGVYTLTEYATNVYGTGSAFTTINVTAPPKSYLGTITHNLGRTPEYALVTLTLQDETYAVTNLTATTFDLYIKNTQTGLAGINQTVYWCVG